MKIHFAIEIEYVELIFGRKINFAVTIWQLSTKHVNRKDKQFLIRYCHSQLIYLFI